jgi:hypothetical protein
MGQQALELQLERFFTVWAWKWDIQEDLEFGNCLGASRHACTYLVLVTEIIDHKVCHCTLCISPSVQP